MQNLEEKIQEYKAGFRQKVSKDIQEKMAKATTKLKELNLSKKALKSGDKIKEFSLPNALGKQISIKEILSNNSYAILNFYRGGWCPYCSLELNEFKEYINNFNNLNTKIVAISPQTPDATLSTQEKLELSFEVLSDVDNIVSKEFGLVFKLDDEVVDIYKSFNIDLASSNNSNNNEIPIPATYLIDKNMQIIYHFVDEDYTNRLDPAILIKEIENI